MSYSVQLATPGQYAQKLNLWSKPNFMACAAGLQNMEPYHLQCFKGEQLVAVLPVYEKSTFGSKTLKCPAGSYYQGLNLFLESDSMPARRLLDALAIINHLALFLKKRYKRLTLNLSPETFDIRGFTWANLKAKPLYTFTQDLAVVMKPLPDERKKLASARKTDFEMRDELSLDEFIELSVAMNTRKSRELGFDYPNLKTYLMQLYKLGVMRQFNLLKGGKSVSSNILLYDGSQAWTVFRATSSDALKLGASSLHSVLLAELLAKEGFTELDFCGANVPEVARFKAAMGLQLKLFFQIHS